MYTDRQRFLDAIHFKKPQDHLPKLEWAAWWDVTYNRFLAEGLPEGMSFNQSLRYFGLEVMQGFGVPIFWTGAPQPDHRSGVIENEDDYHRIRDKVFCDEAIEATVQNVIKPLKEASDRGEIITRMCIDGFFWCPRTFFGIENHLYSFYDYPELYHEICRDALEFHIKSIEAVCQVLTPYMACVSEDMSYNGGPMLSYDTYKEFVYPYYLKLFPVLKKHGIKIFIDSDGKLEGMIPWLIEAGAEGILPLERQAMVDVAFIRDNYPDFCMMGGFDKTVLQHGEAAIRAEFERLLPVMRKGGYVPTMDHQTPPDCSLENYKTYARLYDEYTRRAVSEWEGK